MSLLERVEAEIDGATARRKELEDELSGLQNRIAYLRRLADVAAASEALSRPDRMQDAAD